jgi:ethanolamine permease
MITVLVLRKKEPGLDRPFKVPFYPYLPVIALIVSSVALVAMTTLNLYIALIYFAIIALTYTAFQFYFKRTNNAR